MYNVSPSPHVRCEESIAKIMWTVVATLAPAALFGIYLFGMPALFNLVWCIGFAVLTEYLVQRWQGKDITVKDGSAVITGLLLAMNIPAGLPWYMCMAGAFIAIAVAKHTMGGLGFNVFNPALIGRAFLLASWPVAMTTWPVALGSKLNAVSSATSKAAVDATTAATPLAILKYQGYDKLTQAFVDKTDLYQTMFLGLHGGSMGETSALLLLIGGLFLIYRGYINWQMPVGMIGTVALLTWIFGGKGWFAGDPLLHILSGGLILGAFFMATDMVTIPMTAKGQLIFAVGAGCIATLIRLKGGYPEGVCYSILFMNALTPLIDRLIKPKRFGARG